MSMSMTLGNIVLGHAVGARPRGSLVQPLLRVSKAQVFVSKAWNSKALTFSKQQSRNRNVLTCVSAVASSKPYFRRYKKKNKNKAADAGEENVKARNQKSNSKKNENQKRIDAEAELTLNSILSETEDLQSAQILRRMNAAIQSVPRLPVALKMVEEMVSRGIIPNEKTYVSLILVCRRQRQSERALVVYEAMKAAHIQPSLRTFNLILRCATQARRREDAQRIKEEMESMGVEMDEKSYTTMMDGIVRSAQKGRLPPSKRVGMVFELFEEMKAKGITPSVYTYNMLIEAYSVAQQVEGAMNVYKEMRKAAVEPDTKTFTALMRCTGRAGRLQLSLAVFGEMKASGVQPTRDIYNHLIVACGSAPSPQVERAFEIFYEMKESGAEKVSPNETTFNSLINAACRGGLPSYAFDAFQVMKDMGLKASLRTYNELIHAASLRGVVGMESAFEVYDSMRIQGEKPDVVTFSTLISACAKARDADRALQVFEEMQSVGQCSPNIVLYHTLLVALGRSGRWEEALQVFREQMVDHEIHNCRPTRATLSILFDACLGRDGAEAMLTALAAEDSSFAAPMYLESPGVKAAMVLYREAVEMGLQNDVSPDAASAAENETVRADLSHHTQSAAIVALLLLTETVRALPVKVKELLIVTGGDVRAENPGRPSKMSITTQALLGAIGLTATPLSTLSTQTLVVENFALKHWLNNDVVPAVEKLA